jgi:hypothetical protein
VPGLGERGRGNGGDVPDVAHLTRRHGTSPAVSTIWRMLTSRGFVTPQPHKRPRSSYVRLPVEQPNERWQTDITHWPLADRTDAEILNWIDDHSRFCLARTAAPVLTAPAVDRAYRAITALHGDPAGVLTDNGAVFTGRYRGHGRVALEVTLHARGVVVSHSRPYLPPTCGKVERFHQTQKKWLATQPSRGHPRPAAGPARRLPRLLNTVGPHRGRRYAGTPVLVLVHDRHIRVLSTCGGLLRDLQLDRSRDYQPQARSERCPRGDTVHTHTPTPTPRIMTPSR